MDIAGVHPAGSSFGLGAVDHLSSQPGPSETRTSQRDLIKAVKALQGAELFGENRELTFVFDRQTNKALARIVDKRTREVIMQLPPESVLRMAEDKGIR
jgi:uncharacterized FlaG/YvyC family protein